MAFIGNSVTTQGFTPAVDYFNGNGSTVAFTLSRPVASVAQIEAVIENVVQNPASAYTVSGNTVTFTSAPPSGTNNVYIKYTSTITQTIAPSQGTVYPSSLSTPNALYWDTNNNVGIGTSSPSKKLDVNGEAKITTGMTVLPATSSLYSVDGTISNYSTTNGLYVTGNDAGWLQLQASGTQSCRIQLFGSTYASGANVIQFATSNTERMRIDSSGNIMFGTATTSVTNGGFTFFNVASQSQVSIGHTSGSPSGTAFLTFQLAGSTIGTITQNGTTGVLYNITSDQRLKENIVDAPSALAKIDSVKVRSFDFKSDGSHVEFGTIAQELYEVAPECVAKGDDGEEIEQTWGVDTSVLVPAMIKAIQELKAEVDALKAQLGK